MLAEILRLVHETSSLPEVFDKKGVLKSFSKFRDKHKKQFSSFVKITNFNITRFYTRKNWKPEIKTAEMASDITSVLLNFKEQLF